RNDSYTSRWDNFPQHSCECYIMPNLAGVRRGAMPLAVEGRRSRRSGADIRLWSPFWVAPSDFWHVAPPLYVAFFACGGQRRPFTWPPSIGAPMMLHSFFDWARCANTGVTTKERNSLIATPWN